MGHFERSPLGSPPPVTKWPKTGSSNTVPVSYKWTAEPKIAALSWVSRSNDSYTLSTANADGDYIISRITLKLDALALFPNTRYTFTFEAFTNENYLADSNTGTASVTVITNGPPQQGHIQVDKTNLTSPEVSLKIEYDKSFPITCTYEPADLAS